MSFPSPTPLLTAPSPPVYCRRTNGEDVMSSLPLLPLSETVRDKPRLIGIARLASEGESLREGHNVEYLTLPSKSLLNRCVSNPQVPFTWTINPYRGCEFGCSCCYARYTHEFMEMRDGMQFEQKIYVKQHAAELLRHDLRRVKPDEAIALGTATDPYQPAERRYEVTRGILEEFAHHARLRTRHDRQVKSDRPRPRPAARGREDESALRPFLAMNPPNLETMCKVALSSGNIHIDTKRD
jgi:hypothetical protein